MNRIWKYKSKKQKKSEVKTQFIDADQTELTGGNKSLTVEKIQNTFTHPWVPGLRQKIVEGKSFDLNEFEQKKKNYAKRTYF